MVARQAVTGSQAGNLNLDSDSAESAQAAGGGATSVRPSVRRRRQAFFHAGNASGSFTAIKLLQFKYALERHSTTRTRTRTAASSNYILVDWVTSHFKCNIMMNFQFTGKFKLNFSSS